MISEEKMIHVLHLMMDGIQKQGMVTYPDVEVSRREARKVALLYLTQMNSVAETARARIMSQKNPPQEGSRQWDTLYQKYLEEEVKKKGG